ncbi:c-type cytochrome [Sphaerotilus microaerophilus]|nr:c-type cytochrome [Sphaerotilus sp. FB-5]
MKTTVKMTALAGIALLAPALALAAGKPNDDAMLKLATTSGCMTCHHIEPGGKGPEGLPPIGPAWKDVAAKYKGDKTALSKLTQTVLKGSNPYESHWKGKASGLAMPPNAVAIKEADAKQLVGWILQLESK